MTKLGAKTIPAERDTGRLVLGETGGCAPAMRNRSLSQGGFFSYGLALERPGQLERAPYAWRLRGMKFVVLDTMGEEGGE